MVFAKIGIRESRTMEEVTIAGDWAIVWGEYQVELTPRQGGESARESATERGKYLDVLRKEDGEWKFARSVWNTSEPRAGAGEGGERKGF